MLIQANALKIPLKDKSVHMVCTSPPYWGLRDYGVNGQLGLEKTPEEYVQKMIEVFREVWRVMRDDGTLWLNLGDSYAANRGYQVPDSKWVDVGNSKGMKASEFGLKPKDLVGIPWRVAFALQADGWYLRSDIIWAKCLSGGSIVYAKTQKGDMPMTIREMSRLKPETVKLWSGRFWVQVREIEEVHPAESLEIRFRNGMSVSCTPEHKWPVRGLWGKKVAANLEIGDIIESCLLPEPEKPSEPKSCPDWLGEVAGLYLAEGSRSGKTVQFSLHAKETKTVDLIQRFADWFGGSLHTHIYGNSCHANVEGKLCVAFIETFIGGYDAKTKHLRVVSWMRSNLFLKYLLTGYLNGDGSKQDDGFWKLGFAANEALARDLRTICARLGYSIRVRWCWSIETKTGKKHKSMRGDLRFDASRRTEDWEIIHIQPSKGRRFYHIAVDEPHLFALASGLLSFNSNPMPESATDRPTKNHEYLFLLTKSPKYYFDQEAIKEPANDTGRENGRNGRDEAGGARPPGSNPRTLKRLDYTMRGRNKRSVWTIATQPWNGAHFATFPEKLVEPCILAGTSERGCCPKCGEPWVRVFFNKPSLSRKKGNSWQEGRELAKHHGPSRPGSFEGMETKTLGWRPSCSCGLDPVSCVVLDPFCGSGTVGKVCSKHRRKFVGMDLKWDYLQMSKQRNRETKVLMFS